MCIMQAGTPLETILHAGGAMADALLPNQTAAGARAAFAAKAAGATGLAAATTSAPLASLQLFSSVSGTLGNAGQANYAAANAVLDAAAGDLQVR